MSEHVNKAETVELENGPEYRVLAHLFGILLACAGLLAGTMVKERSLDYWTEDIVPLLILMLSGHGLLKGSIELARDAMVYAEQKKTVEAFLAKQKEVLAHTGDQPQLAAKPKAKQQFSEDEVLEAVAKRIEEQKEKASRSSKFSS